MANTGIKGRVVFAGTSDGIPGLTVCAFDIDPLSADDHLATGTTDPGGHFTLTYPTGRYRSWLVDRNPDIEVRIFGPAQRLLWETPQAKNVAQDVLDVGTIEIHRNNFPVPSTASETERKNDPSWLTTHTSLDPKRGTPVALTTGNQIDWLVDGADMFPALTEALQNAGTSIKFMNMFFRVGKLFSKFEFPAGKDHKTVQDGDSVNVFRLEKILAKKADAENKPVNVLVWDLTTLELFDSADTTDEVKAFFQPTQVKTDALESTELMHAKLVIVDGEQAFVIGSTMSQGYFSDGQHLIHDARHGGSLIHDVSARLRGPAVRFVDQTFCTVWNVPPSVSTVAPDPQPAPLPEGAGIQILRTLPGELFTSDTPDADTENLPHGETGILEAYQRAIAKAEEFIYIEDQYLTSPEIINAIKERMDTVPALEVILLLNIAPDISGYPKKQAALLNELRDSLGDQQKRLGIFSLWSSDATKSPFEVMNIYVHSKMAIIDDQWATVGSANLDGASLNHRQWGLIFKGVLAELPKKLVNFLHEPLAPGVLFIFLNLLLYLPWLLLALLLPFVPALAPFLLSAIRKETARPSQHANPNRERQPPRHPELNLVLYNDIAGQAPSDKVSELRTQLWTEHLGQAPPPSRPAEGWVAHWSAIAAEHLKSIRDAADTGVFTEPTAKILEWKAPADAEKNLRAHGVKTKNIRVRTEADKIKFNPVDKV